MYNRTASVHMGPSRSTMNLDQARDPLFPSRAHFGVVAVDMEGMMNSVRKPTGAR